MNTFTLINYFSYTVLTFFFTKWGQLNRQVFKLLHGALWLLNIPFSQVYNMLILDRFASRKMDTLLILFQEQLF